MLGKFSLLTLTIVIFVHSFILTKLIFFPYPELFVYPYLTNNGLKPYAQILDQHFPGLLFLPVNFDNLGMTDEVSARIWLAGVVVITHLLLFFISKKIFQNDKKVLLVNLLYMAWQPFFEGWILWIDSFLPIILLPAFYFLQKRRLFLTGVLLGVGIVFKQVIIPLSGLVLIYLVWEKSDKRKIGTYLFGLGLPVTLMVSYLFSIGVLKDFWYWTVIFNLTTYAQYGRGEIADFAHLSRVFFVFGIALLLVLFKIKNKLSQIVLIFLIGTLIGLSTRFDFVHFQPALPFAILATVYGWGRLGRLGTIMYILVTAWWLVIFYRGHVGNRVFFFDTQTKQVAEKIRQNSKTDEKIFIFGAPPNLYQMTERLPAGNIFVFQFPWFLQVAGERVLDEIVRDKPEIVVSDRSVKIDGQPIIEYAKNIDQYIQQNYEVIDKVGTTHILRRKN